MILYRTPGRSFTRPPRTSTIECSCRLCPTPGMYAVTSIWLVSRTRATLRSAEFGFLGVVVYRRVQTPRRCGLPLSAGVLVLVVFAWRPLRTSCWIVGTGWSSPFGPLSSSDLCSCPARLFLSCSARLLRAAPTPAVGRVARRAGPGRCHHTGFAVARHRDEQRGRTHKLPGHAGHEGKEYRPCGRRSKRGPIQGAVNLRHTAG